MNHVSKSDPILILDEVVADGFSTPIIVNGYETVYLAVSSTNSGDCKLRVHGSVEGTMEDRTAPDFTDPSIPGNHHTTLYSVDCSTNTGIDGATGLTLAGTDSANNRLIKVSVAPMQWLSVEVDDYSAGKISVSFVGFAK